MTDTTSLASKADWNAEKFISALREKEKNSKPVLTDAELAILELLDFNAEPVLRKELLKFFRHEYYCSHLRANLANIVVEHAAERRSRRSESAIKKLQNAQLHHYSPQQLAAAREYLERTIAAEKTQSASTLTEEIINKSSKEAETVVARDTNAEITDTSNTNSDGQDDAALHDTNCKSPVTN